MMRLDFRWLAPVSDKAAAAVPQGVTTARVAVVDAAARLKKGLILLRHGAMDARDKPAHDEAIERMRPKNSA